MPGHRGGAGRTRGVSGEDALLEVLVRFVCLALVGLAAGFVLAPATLTGHPSKRMYGWSRPARSFATTEAIFT